MNVALVVGLLLLLQAPSQDSSDARKRSSPDPALLRYNLSAGDHLIYRQTLLITARSLNQDDRIQDPDQSYSYFERWENHLLVTDRAADILQLGIQRNSLQRSLLSYQVGSQDRSERMRPRFEGGEWPRAFAAGNRFTAAGSAQFPRPAVREHPSVSLVGIGEILPLPARAVAVGDRWTEPELFGFQLKVEGWETVNGYRSIRIANDANADFASVRYWFSPELGAMVRIEWEADSDYEGLWLRNEKVRIEWVGKRLGGSPSGWLIEPATRLGLLAALRTSDRIPTSSYDLYSLLDQGDPLVQRMVLGIAYRKRMLPPAERQLWDLLESPDARVRTLAVRLMENLSEGIAQPMIRRAMSDSDPFVRRAAARHRAIGDNSDSQGRRNGVGEAPDIGAEARLDGGPDQVEGAPSGNSVCHADADWPGRLQRARSLPPQLTGDTLRAMRSDGFSGRPYVAYVPEDYRGDEPFPLIVYLSGAGGRPLEGIIRSHAALAQHGYIAVLPDAGGQYWWRDEPAAVVEILMREIGSEFNIDSNRVFLAGYSNGGTGALFLGSRLADRFAAAVSLMGAGLYAEEAPLQFRFPNLSSLPTLFLHGGLDREVPVIGTIDTVKRILAANPAAPIQSHVFPNREHDLWLGSDEGRTMAFIQDRQRDPFPKRIRFQTGQSRQPRHYWIEVTDRDAPEAYVEASIEGNLITIESSGVRRLKLLLQRGHLPDGGPVRIVWNRLPAFEGRLPEDCDRLAASLQALQDPFRAYSMELEIELPRPAERR